MSLENSVLEALESQVAARLQQTEGKNLRDVDMRTLLQFSILSTLQEIVYELNQLKGDIRELAREIK